MDTSEIKDAKSLQVWLETRPQADSIAIAHRCALRAIPFLFGADFIRAHEYIDIVVLNTLRCVLISGIALKSRTSQLMLTIKPARNHIASWVTAPAGYAKVAEAAAFAVVSAADSVNYARSASSAFRASSFAFPDRRFAPREEVRQDAAALQSNTNPLTLSLWHNYTPPDRFTTAEAAMRTYWQTTNPSHWSFWQRWYDAANAGRPLDWQLQHDIALIPDGIWQSGPGPVAEAIAKIEAEHRKAAAPPLQTDNLPAPTDRTRSFKFVVKQVTLLHELIEDEYEYLRGHNGGSATEQPLLDQQKATLQKLRDLVNAMLAALEGDPSPSTALTVVNETLPVVVTEAETLTDQGAKPQVSAEIINMAATIKVLTESGAPGDLATKFAFANSSRNWFWSMFSKYRKQKP